MPDPAPAPAATSGTPGSTTTEVTNGAAPAVAEGATPAAAEAAATPEAAEAQRVGDLIKTVQKREQQIAQVQQRMARERQDLQRMQAQLTEGMARLEKETAALASDPLAWLAARGITSDALADRLTSKDGKGSGVDRIDRLERELAAEREWRTNRERQEAEATSRATVDRELDVFESEARAASETHPRASKLQPRLLRKLAWEIAVESGQQGVSLTNPEILDRLEEALTEHGSTSSATRTLAATAQSSKPGPTTTPAPSAVASAKSAVEAVDVLKLTPAQERERLLAVVRDARARGARLV